MPSTFTFFQQPNDDDHRMALDVLQDLGSFLTDRCLPRWRPETGRPILARMELIVKEMEAMHDQEVGVQPTTMAHV